ncbi:MAG: DoxX family protein [Anaerolineales bacterium]
MEQPEVVHISESPFSRALFGNVRWAWLWLLTRLAVGYLWIHAGWGKLHNPAWVGANAGTGLNGFIQGALQKTGGAYPQVQSWYAWFLSNVVQPNVRIMSYVVSLGEFLVGLALILGIFVGIAAFFGVVMNVNYLLAGSISMNPLMLLGATTKKPRLAFGVRKLKEMIIENECRVDLSMDTGTYKEGQP